MSKTKRAMDMDAFGRLVWTKPEPTPDHECEIASQCCGAGRHEYVDDICAACNEFSGFDCIECSR